MKKFVVVHRRDENNVGDMASNPLQYFLEPEEYDTVDITDLGRAAYDPNLPVIVGGGGLVGNEFFGDIVKNVLHSSDNNQLRELWNHRWELSDPANKEVHDEFIEKYTSLISEFLQKLNQNRSPRYFWGGGYNGEYNKKTKLAFDWPDWMSEFDKVGVRDYGQNLPWVPCASCMHPALRQTYSIKNDIIWFEHKKQLVKDFGNEPIPRFVNSGSNIEQTIELLGSANIILTNSYHGAYWGTLLGKKVIVVGAWGAKFYAFRHKPYILEKNESWQEAVDKVMIHPNALDECIAGTENFWNSIKSR